VEDGTFVLLIPAGQAGPLSLEIRIPSNREIPVYRELRDLQIPNIQPGTKGIDIRLARRD